jgi:hypothetical protein
MRNVRFALLIAVLAILITAPTVGLACDETAGGTTACNCGASKDGKLCAAESAKTASAAEKGCAASMEKLIVWAKQSDDEKTAALAAKAEGGCEKSQSALIAMAKGPAESESPSCSASTASMAQLASKAEGGCPEATAALIAKAKASGDEKYATLAGKAAGGCEHSKSALIALAKESGSPDEN